ncbi:hypothetical protein SAMN06296386_10194 [Lachnospiraceae bacterium]|nr:hypothetical protein SAMN06296386_10194 [Lachnospiraceae bacterium]
MSIRKTLLLLTLNYICIFFWIFSYRAALFSVLFLFPVTILIVTFNSLLLDDRKSIMFWCLNLMLATTVGIMIQTWLVWKYFGPWGIWFFIRMVIEIIVSCVFIYIAAVIAGGMSEKAAPARRRRRERRRLRRERVRDKSPLAKGGDGYEGYDLDEMEEVIAEEDPRYESMKGKDQSMEPGGRFKGDQGDYIRAPKDDEE